MRKHAFTLVFGLLIIVVFAILLTGLVAKSVSERMMTRAYADSTQAFWLAEAGINRAFVELQNNYNLSGANLFPTTLGQGSYAVSIATNGQNKVVTAYGYIPSAVNPRITRTLEATFRKSIPPNFFDNVIYGAGNIDISGNSYSVNGNVIYADNFTNDDNVTGNIVHDPSIKPLARFNFTQLRQISVNQGNLYTQQRLNNKDPFPVSFWNVPPSGGNPGIPNVVYIEGDMVVKGNTNVGGFFVVAGNVITQADATADATLSGNVNVAGAVYTRGTFRVNGGGNKLNIDGGVWASAVDMNGGVTLTYNAQYMSAIAGLNTNPEVQVLLWKDLDKPYKITP